MGRGRSKLRVVGRGLLVAALVPLLARPAGAAGVGPGSAAREATVTAAAESPPDALEAPDAPPDVPETPAGVAPETPVSAAELDARIAALRAERDETHLTGPIVGTTLGALVFWAGLQLGYAAQVSCRGIGLSGGYDCSDDTIWGLTAGAGAAIVVGAITVAIVGPRLSKRLARRRTLTHEIRRLELEREEAGAARPRPELDWGLAITRERQALQAVIRF